MSSTSQRIADLSPAEKRALLGRASSKKGGPLRNRLIRSPTISKGYGFFTNSRRRVRFTMSISRRAFRPNRCSGNAARVSDASRSASCPAHDFPRALRQTDPASTPNTRKFASRKWKVQPGAEDELKTRSAGGGLSPVRSGTRASAASESVHSIGTGTHSSAGRASHRDRFLVARDASRMNSACYTRRKAPA